MFLCHLHALSFTEYSGMDKSSRTNGGNGRSLCNHHPSGASSYSFTRACNELARVYHAARESYLLERNVITSHTFLRTTGQHHPITLPMLKKQDTRSTRTSIKEKTGPFLSSTGYSYTHNHIRNLKSVKLLLMKRPTPVNTIR